MLNDLRYAARILRKSPGFALLAVTALALGIQFGIRIALGATSGNVLMQVLRDALVTVLAGIVIGGAGAAALTRLIRSELYETTPTEPAVYVIVSLLLLAVAGFAGYFPASRAAGIDPIIALREE